MDGASRDYRIDNLRAIGIVLIILAHCEGPALINDFRCFDVILLVYISSLMSKKIDNITLSTYWDIFVKKVKRLLIPTYIFIIMFSFILFFGYRLLGRSELFGMKHLINSILLCESSVGYVWIIKVYFINALLAPLFYKLFNRLKNNTVFVLLIFVEFILYFFGVQFYLAFLDEKYIWWIFIEQWLLCCIAYGIVGQVAQWGKYNVVWKKYSMWLWLFVFFITCIASEDGFYFATSAGKRPVNLHYLSWGLFVTEFLFKVIPDKKCALCEWISRNSLEVYLLHPIFILFFSFFKVVLEIEYKYFWVVEWVLVLFFSCMSVIIVKRFAVKWKMKYVRSGYSK